MARPRQAALKYFSLYTDFFTDPIIEDLRCEFGSIGILTYLFLKCKVHGEGGYWFEIKGGMKVLCNHIASHIANSHHKHVADCVRATIDYLIEQGYVDRYWFERSIVTGIAFQEQYVYTAIKMKRKYSLGVCQLVDPREVMRKFCISSEETPVISEEMQQSKGEVKEKENNPLYNAYGAHKNVRLTQPQYEDLCKQIPNADGYIDHFSERLHVGGYVYNDHHKTILEWWKKDKDKPKKQTTRTQTGSFDTDDFFEAAVKKGFRARRED